MKEWDCNSISNAQYAQGNGILTLDCLRYSMLVLINAKLQSMPGFIINTVRYAHSKHHINSLKQEWWWNPFVIYSKKCFIHNGKPEKYDYFRMMIESMILTIVQHVKFKYVNIDTKLDIK